MSVFLGYVSSQIVEKALDVLRKDSLIKPAVTVVDSDSVLLVAAREELAALRLNEANMRMEMEQMKIAMYVADSI